ncbi:uncharacterized protein LOC143450044 [Clavelina lepadiformis]|uniref:uncharacterized protein LOC143450044 n=1 Tax=Clavelina lepadiformis TaxID=159417 RepID=UPI004041F92F
MNKESLWFIISSLLLHDVNGLNCYACENAQSDEECLHRKVACGVDQNVCYTEVRNTSSGYVLITKSCYQDHACSILERQNEHSCPVTCSLCCSGNFCNAISPKICTCKSTNPVTEIGLTRGPRGKDGGRRTPRPGSTLTFVDDAPGPPNPATACQNQMELESIAITAPRLDCENDRQPPQCKSTASVEVLSKSDGLFISNFTNPNITFLCKRFPQAVVETSTDDGNAGVGLSCVSKATAEVFADNPPKANHNSWSVVNAFCSTLKHVENINEVCSVHKINCTFGTAEYGTDTKSLPVAVSKPFLEIFRKSSQRSVALSQNSTKNFSLSTTVIPRPATHRLSTPLISTVWGESLPTQNASTLAENSSFITQFTTNVKYEKSFLSPTEGATSLQLWAIILTAVSCCVVLAFIMWFLHRTMKSKGVYHVNRVAPQSQAKEDDLKVENVSD